ncbi:MAG: dienelactone hydrolase family protein [Acidobacteriota bacterium]
MKRIVAHCSVIALLFAVSAVESATRSRADRGGPMESSRALAETNVDCSAFTVNGDPRSATGATWAYQSTDLGARYRLEGILFIPSGAGPFPAVIISHGKGGSPAGYSANIARVMVGWGLAVIAVMYAHAPDNQDSGNEPDGGDGASEANVLRAHKTRDLLSCLGNVDMTRIAAHGHSMGAFVTGQLLGAYPTDFRAASHTAGGVVQGPYATKREAAERIITPYQLHHGDEDIVVALFLDQILAGILSANGVTHELNVYQGYNHQEIASDPLMLERVRNWYRAHGVLQSAGLAITDASVSGKKLYVTGKGFDDGAVIVLNGKDQKTKNDDQNPDMRLIAKKAGKKIDSGQSVSLRVRNPDGELSAEIIFTRP